MSVQCNLITLTLSQNIHEKLFFPIVSCRIAERYFNSFILAKQSLVAFISTQWMHTNFTGQGKKDLNENFIKFLISIYTVQNYVFSLGIYFSPVFFDILLKF